MRNKLLIVTASATILVGCGGGQQKTEEKSSRTELSPMKSSGSTSENGETSIQKRLRTQRFTGDLGDIVKRRYLRVLVLPDRISFFFDGTQLRGAMYETMTEFEAVLNRKLKTGKTPVKLLFVPVPRDQVLQLLADGRGDIAAGRLPITERGKQLVDFSDPVVDEAEAVAVTGPATPPLSSVEDLSGREAYVVQVAGGSESLAPLNAHFRQEGKPELKITYADENLAIDDVLEMVNAGLVPMTFAVRSVAQLWAKVFDHIQVHSEIVVAHGSLAWAVRKNTPQLLAEVNDFVRDHKVGTSFGNTVLRRYLSNTKWVENAASKEEIAKFQQMVSLFRKFGDQYDFPFLLVAAQAYQESRLNHQLRSPAGAVGVMQIKPETAAAKPIEMRDITKLDRNIQAGVKYLRFLEDHYFKDEPMDRVNKGLFTIASYNAGPNKIQQLRRETAAEGFDPNRWFNNVEVIASKRIGRETVQYVSNIFKYYLAYKMVTDQEALRHEVVRKRNGARPSGPEK